MSSSCRRKRMHEVRWAFQLVTGPATEPVTQAEARLQCRIDGSDEDVGIAARIAKARAVVESDASRQLVTATWKLWLDEFPDVIEIRKCPVQSVSSITYVASDGTTATLDAADYRVDAVSEPARIEPAFGEAWPTTREVVNAVCVTFVAGYGAASAVDPVAKQAVLLLVATDDLHREEVLASGKALEVPTAARHLIDRLRWDY